MNKEREEVKAEFIKYLKENPDLRFWQAIRAFSGADKILYEKDGFNVDTYYWQEKSEYE